MLGERGCLPDRCPALQSGQTPLHRAAYSGHAAVVEQLLAVGADVEAKDEVRGEGGTETRIGRGRGAPHTSPWHLCLRFV